VQHELRIDAYSNVQGLDLAYFEDRSSGGLMAVLNDDVNQLERFLDYGADQLIQMLATVVLIGATFFVLAPEVAWLAFLPIPVILYASVHFQRRLEPRYAAVRDQAAAVNSRLANNFGGISTIKAFTTEQHEIGRIREESEAYRLANSAAIKLSSAFSPAIRIVILVGFIATLVWGGLAVLDGDLAPWAYATMIFLTQRLLWPLTRLGETLDLYQRAMASTNRILDILDTDPTIVSGTEPLARHGIKGHFELDAVTFSYTPGTPVVTDLTLDIPARETTAFVGATGAGKTTLVKLLLRLYDPDSGEIRLDGVPIDRLVLDDLRRGFGLVSQDVFLFHGTVAENIAYGRPGASQAEIEEAARTAEAHDFVTALPGGYATVVGERGQKLSGGQRQRISIARAVLLDPPILLLDEATSAVDNETEAAIQRSMERLGQGRTVIIIAHRLSTVRNADRIYVLEGGAVSDVGTHEELVARDGLYRALWRVQTGERGRPAPGPPDPGEPNPGQTNPGRSGRHGPDTRR
jgi:ATP-binding cassette subfamily B protein